MVVTVNSWTCAHAQVITEIGCHHAWADSPLNSRAHMGPLEIQAEKVLFFRCKSDFFREITTFFSKHVGKKVLKKSAFVKCGTFCWNVEFVEFCSISWIFPKKAKMTENRHFWSIQFDPGRGIALISSLMPASPYFPH